MLKYILIICFYVSPSICLSQNYRYISPEIHPDKSVSFRIYLPSAIEVFVYIDDIGQMYQLEKNKDLWAITTNPLPSGIYTYNFHSDGMELLDPKNPEIKPDLIPRKNILEIPSKSQMFYDLKPVPHGIVHQHKYFSQTLGLHRDLFVYTPPNYDTKKKYPVLYLLHDAGESEEVWIEVGKINNIIDNLIAQENIEPMIVVFPFGHVLSSSGVFENQLLPKEIYLFEQDLIKEIIPLIDSQYSSHNDSNYRAIAGHSYGGTQAFIIGLRNIDLFSWIGVFGSGITRYYIYNVWDKTNSKSSLNNFLDLNDKLKLLWIACGNNDRLFQENSELSNTLNDFEINHTFYETNNDHSWNGWRFFAKEFVQIIAGKH
ncbi:alpha/beta hydrolase-fold protein [Candidatus Latescibacterota bacterium]